MSSSSPENAFVHIRGSTILIACNQREFVRLCSGVLYDAGVGLHNAHSSTETVAKFIKYRPEIVVIDSEMEDGLIAVEEILAIKPTSKVILLVNKANIPEIGKTNAEIIMAKPVLIKRLLDAIVALCMIKPTSPVVSP